jgi:hypothetical protein
MLLNRDELMLLSRTGRVPSARSKGPPLELQPELKLECQRVAVRQRVRLRSLVDSLLAAASMKRTAVVSAQEQRQNR